MNILEYIEDLMDQGMSEEDAGLCADVYFNLDHEPEDSYSEAPSDYYGE